MLHFRCILAKRKFRQPCEAKAEDRIRLILSSKKKSDSKVVKLVVSEHENKAELRFGRYKNSRKVEGKTVLGKSVLDGDFVRSRV